MKAKRKIADLNWELDDNIIVVTIPMQWSGYPLHTRLRQ